MTDFSDVEYYGPNAPACNARRKAKLDSLARQAHREQAAIDAYMHGGPDPERSEITICAGFEAKPEPAKPKPAKTAMAVKLAAAKDKLAKLKRRKR